MNSWLLSIIGVVFLGVLFDLIYPNGKTNTLCKSIFGIFAMFVILSPLFNFEVDKVISDVSTDTVLIDNINKAKDNAIKIKIDNHLNNENIIGAIVEIESNLNLNEYYIKNIFVDSTNLVLTENVTNINKYEVIANEISKVVDVDKERIIVYG